jgi:hypothetical protein
LREQQLLGNTHTSNNNLDSNCSCDNQCEKEASKRSTSKRLKKRKSLSSRNLLGNFLSAQSAVDRAEDDRGGYSVC